MKAYNIALKALKECYGDRGIFAGTNHFNDYWTRDSCFAMLGAIAIKDFDVVKKNLELVFSHMKSNGQLPFRIGELNMIRRYLKLKNKKIKSRYREDKACSTTTDQNSLFIIAYYEYVMNCKDNEIPAKYFEKVKEIIKWNLNQTKLDLIKERKYASWQDDIKKTGYVLYTNVCYCKALQCMFDLTGEPFYGELYEKVKKKINQLFWNRDYYIDWVNGKKPYDYFDMAGNLLAIVWDIADNEKAKKIINYIDEKEIEIGLTNHPKHKFCETSTLLKIFGMKDYQNGIKWTWLMAMYTWALVKVEDERAKKSLKKLSDLIIKDDGVHEVYDGNKPVQRFFYTSEEPFAWTAGLFVKVYKALKENLNSK
jgi:glycogen debranching enzyme